MQFNFDLQQRKKLGELLNGRSFKVLDLTIGKNGIEVKIELQERTYFIAMPNKPTVLKQLRASQKTDKFYINFIFNIIYEIINNIKEPNQD